MPQAFPLPARHTPVVSCGGYLTCQLPTGGLKTVLAPPYKYVEPEPRASAEVQRLRFCQNLALLRLEEAWRTALALDDRGCMLALSGKAMEVSACCYGGRKGPISTSCLSEGRWTAVRGVLCGWCR